MRMLLMVTICRVTAVGPEQREMKNTRTQAQVRSQVRLYAAPHTQHNTFAVQSHMTTYIMKCALMPPDGGGAMVAPSTTEAVYQNEAFTTPAPQLHARHTRLQPVSYNRILIYLIHGIHLHRLA